MAANATGLTLADGTAVPYATAVAGIAKLRDVLGGTSSSSVENNLTRTPTPYTSSVNTTGPALFAVNSAAVAFVRSPYQVREAPLCNSCWGSVSNTFSKLIVCRYSTLCTFQAKPVLEAFSHMA